ncbi:hypothetical protein EC968_010097 [Mortierella alpina]|nr:hypothetical protein EC968_010097 [Mortierella alpina]
MFKSCILLGLAFAIGAVSAAENDTVSAASEADLGINFWGAWYNEGAMTYCLDVKFDQCYTFTDDIINTGLSSATFDNNSIWAKRFTFTLFSGTACNGDYDKWSFTHTFQDPPYNIIAFPTLNDNVRSFKVVNAFSQEGSTEKDQIAHHE